jgi:hypothetical protein
MSVTDDDRNREDGVNQPTTDPVRRRNRQLVISVVVLAAVLSTGAYFVTDRLTGKDTGPAEVGALAPVVVASGSTGPTSVGPTSGRPSASASVAVSAPASVAPITPELRKQIEAVRRQMAEDGVRVKRPLPGASQEVAGLRTTTQGSLNSGGIVRMVTARGDLAGQRELAWVAGGTKKYRGVPCSQTVRFSEGAVPQRKANLLICWRTSAKKSVISIVVDPDGRPSREKAVDALEAKWRSMG